MIYGYKKKSIIGITKKKKKKKKKQLAKTYNFMICMYYIGPSNISCTGTFKTTKMAVQIDIKQYINLIQIKKTPKKLKTTYIQLTSIFIIIIILTEII